MRLVGGRWVVGCWLVVVALIERFRGLLTPWVMGVSAWQARHNIQCGRPTVVAKPNVIRFCPVVGGDRSLGDVENVTRSEGGRSGWVRRHLEFRW